MPPNARMHGRMSARRLLTDGSSCLGEELCYTRVFDTVVFGVSLDTFVLGTVVFDVIFGTVLFGVIFGTAVLGTVVFGTVCM
jgi:hypothetical protein